MTEAGYPENKPWLAECGHKLRSGSVLERFFSVFPIRRADGAPQERMSWGEFAADEPEMAAVGRQLLYRRGDGEGLLATLAGDGLPRIHPVNVGVVDDRLLVFVAGSLGEGEGPRP